MQVRPLLRRLKAALPLLPRPLPAKLSRLDFILVDRDTMVRVHGDFLDDPTETDVITFPYGEIVVCPAVAQEQAEAHGLSTNDEVLLYCLHGLLHLAGYDDTTPALAKEMGRAQTRLLKDVREGGTRSRP